MNLLPHRKYSVRGQEMFFWRYRDDGTPEFYHYQKYGDTRHIIYFWDKDIKEREIVRVDGPMLSTIDVTIPQVVNI